MRGCFRIRLPIGSLPRFARTREEGGDAAGKSGDCQWREAWLAQDVRSSIGHFLQYPRLLCSAFWGGGLSIRTHQLEMVTARTKHKSKGLMGDAGDGHIGQMGEVFNLLRYPR